MIREMRERVTGGETTGNQPEDLTVWHWTMDQLIGFPEFSITCTRWQRWPQMRMPASQQGA